MMITGEPEKSILLLISTQHDDFEEDDQKCWGLLKMMSRIF